MELLWRLETGVCFMDIYALLPVITVSNRTALVSHLYQNTLIKL
jgi:hypothetical protein